ncbi:Longitudinals lacking protein, isoforms A/B/D/L [Frankliniella fusca]|uniref:Longitudinals lacking protein, isoforms A/B/D/L n=1 Tax=Frankliniella fusca TaxID=407009 RepID=A0AAE1H655_9NEOP|nr:Longitudinals lacking protein, isoforms A/B/D/L [Frankliniella fusca]
MHDVRLSDSSRDSSPKRSSWGGAFGLSWEKWALQHPLMPVMLARSSSPLDLGSSSSLHFPGSAANGSTYAGNNSAENSFGGHHLSADDSFGRSGEKVEECGQCGRRYKLKSSLRNHIKWECGKEPQFQCPFCSYRAKQKMHVVRHVERMHKEKIEALGTTTD